MSTKYKIGDEVPTYILIKRLKELSAAATKGKHTLEREFTMRIPAEVDRDADIVLSAAARRLKNLGRDLNNKQLDMAEQQIWGYYSAKNGESLSSLIESMGLTFKECCQLNESGMLDYLPQSFKDEILGAVDEE